METIETKRLILRPWNEDDAELLYGYSKDPRVGPMAGWNPHKSINESREILKNVLMVEENYAICRKEDKLLVGCIGLKEPALKEGTLSEKELEVGYWIGVPHWGNGYMPEAVRVLQRHAFEDLGCSALWCGYYDGNVKSKRTMEKCGFVYHHTEYGKECVLLKEIRNENFTYLTREMWQRGFSVRKLVEKEIPQAIELCWEVFLRFEAPEYSEEGIKTFRASLDDEERTKKLVFYGAFEADKMIGTLTMRDGNHIGDFFVKEEYQRRGVGRALFELMCADNPQNTYTVNSSPCAVKIYERLGFTAADSEKTVSGLRFIPMVRK